MALWLWMALALVRSVVVLVACHVIATLAAFSLSVIGVVDPAAFDEVRNGLTALVLIGVLLTMWQSQGRQPARRSPR